MPAAGKHKFIRLCECNFNRSSRSLKEETHYPANKSRRPTFLTQFPFRTCSVETIHLVAVELSKPPPLRTMSLLCFPRQWGEVLGDREGSCGGILGQELELRKEEHNKEVLLGSGVRLQSVVGWCVVGTCESPLKPPPPHPSNLFWLQKRPKRQSSHLQIRSCPAGKKMREGRNQWSCINLLTANVLHILILDPFTTAFQTNSIVLLDPTYLVPLY